MELASDAQAALSLAFGRVSTLISGIRSSSDRLNRLSTMVSDIRPSAAMYEYSASETGSSGQIQQLISHFPRVRLSLDTRTAWAFIGVAFAIWMMLKTASMIYSVYFSPLSKFPGSRLASATLLPATYWTFRGKMHEWVAEQHRKYGPIVRIRPGELSFIEPAAWRDIYAHRQDQQQMPKVLRTKPINGSPSIMSAGDEEHARQRKLLAHAFSDNALRSQEPLVNSYVDLLVKQLRDEADSGRKTQDMTEWLTYTTFDIVGDLSFGKSFGNLANKRSHPWVATLKSGIKQGILFVAFRSLGIPGVDGFLAKFISPIFQAKRHEQARYAAQAVAERLQRKTERNDFIHAYTKNNDMDSITQAEIESVFTIVALAGCESPATALSGVFYNLLSNPNVYEKLCAEVRQVQSSDELTIKTVSNMTYLKAVLDESQRVYPAVPAAMDRVVPGDGAMIAGHWVPSGTWVGVPQYAANHSDRNFVFPEKFLPERYIPKSKSSYESGVGHYDEDRFAVVQPFSQGPRNCIGQNLAKAEMRTILAKLIYNFDMKLSDTKTDWFKIQHVYGLWDKEPLMVEITPRSVA